MRDFWAYETLTSCTCTRHRLGAFFRLLLQQETEVEPTAMSLKVDEYGREKLQWI